MQFLANLNFEEQKLETIELESSFLLDCDALNFHFADDLCVPLYRKKLYHSHYAYFAVFRHQHTLFYHMEKRPRVYKASVGRKLCEPCREN